MSARAGAGDAPGAPRVRALPVAMALREAGLAAFVMAVLAFPLIGFVLADVSGGVTLRTRFEWVALASAIVFAGRFALAIVPGRVSMPFAPALAAAGGALSRSGAGRWIGPALAGFGVAGTLALPKLTVFDSTATAITENLGWESAGISDQIIAASQSVGAFGLTRGTADSVVLAVLPPGGYTAQVIGADGGSGVTLIEVYELP